MTKNKSSQLDINDSFGVFSHEDDTQQRKRLTCHQSDMDQSESWVVPKIKYRQSHYSSHFRIIVCGDSGIGKTSLVQALTNTTPTPTIPTNKTRPMNTLSEPIEVMNSSMDLCVIDTCGYGALLRAENVFSSVKSYLQLQFQKTSQLFNSQANDIQRLDYIINQSSDCFSHVDCCLYLIMGRIKQVDIEYMRTIHELVNIIPVIIQPDLSLPPEFIIQQRLDVLHTLSANEIKFNHLGYTDDDDIQQACKLPTQHPSCPPFMLDWSSTKRTFHGLLPLKQALYQHATNSIYLKQDTTRKFIQWRSTHNTINSGSMSSSSSTTTNSTCPESIQQNIRISQYVSERRHSMEKELLRLRKEFESASKHKKTELILNEINALVMDNKQDVLVQRLLNHNTSNSSSNRNQVTWVSLSFTLFIIICYLHFGTNNNNYNYYNNNNTTSSSSSSSSSNRPLPFD